MNKKRVAEHLEKVSTFKVVGDLKSIQKASFRLGLTQPAVTRTVKTLEDVLECKLIERQSKGIKLTKVGERLYEYAALQERQLEMFDFSENQSSRPTPPLHFTTYDNIMCGLLSESAARIIEEIPQISFFSGGPNSKILTDILSEKTDCALIAEPRSISGIKYSEVFKERYGLFVSPKLRKNPVLTADKLKKTKIIAMPDAIAGANKTIDRLLWEVGLNSIVGVSSFQVAVQLVMDKVGVGIIPYSSAYRYVRDGKLHEISLKGISSKKLGEHSLQFCSRVSNAHPGCDLLLKRLSETYRAIK
jgi:DNA-binding transcriptional LysR family regulator